MAIEIREIVIKTEIRTSSSRNKTKMVKGDLDQIKRELLDECKRIIFESTKKKIYKR